MEYETTGLEPVVVTDKRAAGGFEGEVHRALFTFRNGERRLFTHDVAHALDCVLAGAGHKMAAGCLFTDTGDGVVVNAGSGSAELTYSGAQALVADHLDA